MDSNPRTSLLQRNQMGLGLDVTLTCSKRTVHNDHNNKIISRL